MRRERRREREGEEEGEGRWRHWRFKEVRFAKRYRSEIKCSRSKTKNISQNRQ
jgi:hypothetical protein